ncbi:MAG TPA: hypothetical protein VNT60_02260 [Deinococcales bacterium]|nr:hypothetical protein [Deinococcales bacterium]
MAVPTPPPEPRKALMVHDPLAARLLADPEVAVLLKPFMRSPVTLKAAAEEARVPIQKMHYRALAACFRVPLELVPEAQRLALETRSTWERSFAAGVEATRAARLPAASLVVGLDASGTLVWREDDGPGADGKDGGPVVVNVWHGSLRLSRDEAQELAAAMQALLDL